MMKYVFLSKASPFLNSTKQAMSAQLLLIVIFSWKERKGGGVHFPVIIVIISSLIHWL